MKLNIVTKLINSLAGISTVFILQNGVNTENVIKFYWLFALFQSHILFEMGINNVIVREFNPNVFRPFRTRLKYLKKNIILIFLSSLIMVSFLAITIALNKNYPLELPYIYILVILPFLLILNIWIYSYDAVGKVLTSAFVRLSMSICSAIALLMLFFFDIGVTLFFYYLAKLLILIIFILYFDGKKFVRYLKVLIKSHGNYELISIFNPFKIGLTNITGYWLAGGLTILFDNKINIEQEYFFGYYVSLFLIILFVSNSYLSTYLYKFYGTINSIEITRVKKLKFYIDNHKRAFLVYFPLCFILFALIATDLPIATIFLPSVSTYLILQVAIIFALHISLIIDAYVFRAKGNELHYLIMLSILLSYYFININFNISLKSSLNYIIFCLTIGSLFSKMLVWRKLR